MLCYREEHFEETSKEEILSNRRGSMMIGSQKAKLTKIEEFKFHRKKKAKKAKAHPSNSILKAIMRKSP